MISWRKAVEDYVDMRCSLGFKLHDAKSGLKKFASFLEQRRATRITISLAMEPGIVADGVPADVLVDAGFTGKRPSVALHDVARPIGLSPSHPRACKYPIAGHRV